MAEGLFLADNEAYVDWWLLQKFPGKTLEELDSIDWPRLQRAMEVDRIVESEQRRLAWYEGGCSTEPDAADLRLWAQHDKILGVDED
jgi:hypothetical protein